jgi:hypothetical protein
LSSRAATARSATRGRLAARTRASRRADLDGHRQRAATLTAACPNPARSRVLTCLGPGRSRGPRSGPRCSWGAKVAGRTPLGARRSGPALRKGQPPAGRANGAPGLRQGSLAGLRRPRGSQACTPSARRAAPQAGQDARHERPARVWPVQGHRGARSSSATVSPKSFSSQSSSSPLREGAQLDTFIATPARATFGCPTWSLMRLAILSSAAWAASSRGPAASRTCAGRIENHSLPAYHPLPHAAEGRAARMRGCQQPPSVGRQRGARAWMPTPPSTSRGQRHRRRVRSGLHERPSARPEAARTYALSAVVGLAQRANPQLTLQACPTRL